MTRQVRTIAYVDGLNLYITSSRLAGAQLPNPIPGTTIHKPATW